MRKKIYQGCMKNENKNSDPRRTSSVRSAAGTSIVGVPHTIRSLLAPSTVLSARSAAGTSIRMHKEEEEEEGNDRLRPPLKLPPGLGFRRRGIRVFNPLYSHSMILLLNCILFAFNNTIKIYFLYSHSMIL
jgi:hypothetical protein